MKKVKHLFIPISLIVLLLLSVTTGYAQGQVITANVDRSTLSTGDTLTLTVSVNTGGINTADPSLPALPGFNLIGSSTSSQITIINGAMSMAVHHTYSLQPYETGNLVIEPISVTVDGQTFSTDPITVQVSQGTGNPGRPSSSTVPSANPTAPTSTGFQGQELFVEAEVNDSTPYIGEQVIYTIRFYQARDIFNVFDQPQYVAPPFTGFWTENTEQSQYQVQAGGHLYDVTELRTILFPSVMGPVTIEPARLVIPGGFFSRGGELRTEPVHLEVKPMPARAPASFNGAVGQFSLEATTDTTQSKVNEPITWQITLSGWGNLNALADPIWPEMPEWRTFESNATTNAQFQDGHVTGSRVYEHLLVPQAEGEYIIPAVEFTYFDPVAEMYQTISSQPIPVSIAPGDPGTTPQAVPGGSAGIDKETIEQLATDIRHLKPVPSELRAGNPPITEAPLYWLAWAVPLASLAGNFVWQRRQQYWQHNAGLARSSKAWKKAKKALAEARQAKDIYSAAGLVLTNYLADKLNQPVAGLTHQALADLLTEKGFTSVLIERINGYLAEAELGRFSPEADSPAHAQNLLKEIDAVIRDVEKSF
jgi:hypothetical protein